MSGNDTGTLCVVIMNHSAEGHELNMDTLFANATSAAEEHKTVLTQTSGGGGESKSLILNFPLL